MMAASSTTTGSCSSMVTKIDLKAIGKDGYDWLKYGQKTIYGNVFTRTYFRCRMNKSTQCEAKKTVDFIRNSSGNGTKAYEMKLRTLYSGEHNHERDGTHCGDSNLLRLRSVVGDSDFTPSVSSLLVKSHAGEKSVLRGDGLHLRKDGVRRKDETCLKRRKMLHHENLSVFGNLGRNDTRAEKSSNESLQKLVFADSLPCEAVNLQQVLDLRNKSFEGGKTKSNSTFNSSSTPVSVFRNNISQEFGIHAIQPSRSNGRIESKISALLPAWRLHLPSRAYNSEKSTDFAPLHPGTLGFWENVCSPVQKDKSIGEGQLLSGQATLDPDCEDITSNGMDRKVGRKRQCSSGQTSNSSRSVITDPDLNLTVEMAQLVTKLRLLREQRLSDLSQIGQYIETVLSKLCSEAKSVSDQTERECDLELRLGRD